MLVIDHLGPEAITFPGGEEHVKLSQDAYHKCGEIAVLNPTSSNLFRLAMVVDALRRDRYILHTLHIPYFPGARQDRAIRGTALSAKVYADFINRLQFAMVKIVDPHSDVITALIDNAHVTNHVNWFLGYIKTTIDRGPYTFLMPDAGALKKYGPQYEEHGVIRYCTKRRDPASGKLSGFSVPDLRDRKDSFIWIIDDIIDGGGTFNAIRSEIDKQGKFAFVGLAATHGIFSKGISAVADNFDKVVVAHQMGQGLDHPNFEFHNYLGIYQKV